METALGWWSGEGRASQVEMEWSLLRPRLEEPCTAPVPAVHRMGGSMEWSKTRKAGDITTKEFERIFILLMGEVGLILGSRMGQGDLLEVTVVVEEAENPQVSQLQVQYAFHFTVLSPMTRDDYWEDRRTQRRSVGYTWRGDTLERGWWRQHSISSRMW